MGRENASFVTVSNRRKEHLEDVIRKMNLSGTDSARSLRISCNRVQTYLQRVSCFWKRGKIDFVSPAVFCMHNVSGASYQRRKPVR